MTRTTVWAAGASATPIVPTVVASMFKREAEQQTNSTARLKPALTRARTQARSLCARVPHAPWTANAQRRAASRALVAVAHARTSALPGTSHSTLRRTCAMEVHAPLVQTASVAARAKQVFALVERNLSILDLHLHQMMAQVCSGCGSFWE